MTSTCSANATALPSRRALIAQAGMLASIGAAGVTMAMPALAGQPGPIERMHAEHVRLSHAYDAAIEATWDAEARYEEPERPGWHPFTTEGSYTVEHRGRGKGRCYLDDSDENIARLQELIAAPYAGDATCMVSVNTHEVRAERAKSSLAQIKAWKAEAKRRADAVGLTPAQEAEASARAAVDEHLAKILAIEPTTFRELAFRAAVLLLTWDEAEMEQLPERLIALAGIAPHHRPD